MSLNKLRKIEEMVISDPEILGGTPVFRNTRVPVHAIAEMLDSGTSVGDILSGYPSISEEKIRLAQLYAQAHPRRGRPATTPGRVQSLFAALAHAFILPIDLGELQ